MTRFNSGDRVNAPTYEGSLMPATIENVLSIQYTVVFDNGDRQFVFADDKRMTLLKAAVPTPNPWVEKSKAEKAKSGVLNKSKTVNPKTTGEEILSDEEINELSDNERYAYRTKARKLGDIEESSGCLKVGDIVVEYKRGGKSHAWVHLYQRMIQEG